MAKQKKPKPAEFYSVTQAAQILNVTPARVRAMCGILRQMNATKVGETWIISAAEVERAKGRKTTPGPEPRKGIAA